MGFLNVEKAHDPWALRKPMVHHLQFARREMAEMVTDLL